MSNIKTASWLEQSENRIPYHQTLYMEFLTTRPCTCRICGRVQLPSTELHLLDSTAHDVFNCKYDVFNLLLTSLARDAYALGCTKVEVEIGDASNDVFLLFFSKYMQQRPLLWLEGLSAGYLSW